MAKTAKAAVMTAAGMDLEIKEYPLPTVDQGCVLVRIICCTICGSDVHSWIGRRAAPTPIILGHEIVGQIVEFGEGVTHDSGDRPLKVGDRITWTIMDNCGKCYYCREKGLMMKPFENVLIQGAGALGFYAAALARHYGCRRIIVTDILDHRLEFIKAFGATDTLNVKGMSDDDTIQAVRGLTGGFGVDCVIEVAGLPSLIALGLKCLRTGGRYVEIGNSSPGADFIYDACDIVWRRLALKGIHNYDTKHLQMGVDLLAMTHDVFHFKYLVTHRVSLDNINDGLRIADSGEAVLVAVLP
jgi:threonine dehydrogenase-like Zn-dependent dehydrogenase